MNAIGDWADFHVSRERSSSYPKWPDSTILKLCFGRYLANPIDLPPDARVVDVGCGFGNNLLAFAAAGYSVCGVEVSPDICRIAEGFLSERGFEADIRVGNNREIPFEDGSFDLLLSVNAVHYEQSEDDVALALKEFRRVLRRGGRIVLMSVAPQHEIRAHAEEIGQGRHRIGGYDFRDGDTMFFFPGRHELEGLLESAFQDVETGRVTEQLMSRTLDFFVASGAAVS